MKLSVAAIHEAGHVAVAIAYGFTVEEVYISEETGHTAVTTPTLPPEPPGIGAMGYGMNVRHFISDYFISSSLQSKERDLVDIYLAGWSAEEAFFKYDKKYSGWTMQRAANSGCSLEELMYGGFVARAGKDIKAVCDVIGLPESGEKLARYLISALPVLVHSHDLVSGRGLGWRAALMSFNEAKLMQRGVYDEELHGVVQWIYKRHLDIIEQQFSGTRGAMRIKALARELMKCKKLSGSEAVNILEKVKDSQTWKWSIFVDDLFESARQHYEKIVTRIPYWRFP